MILRMIMNLATKTFDVVPVIAFLLLIWAVVGLMKTLTKDLRGMPEIFTIHTMKCRRCGSSFKSRNNILLDIRFLIHKITCKVI